MGELVEPLDDGFAVEDESGVGPDPDLYATEFSEVVGVEAETNKVIVVEERDDTSVSMVCVVGLGGEPAETLAIEATSRVAETKGRNLITDCHFSGDGEAKGGVRCRGHVDELVLGHRVAAIL